MDKDWIESSAIWISERIFLKASWIKSTSKLLVKISIRKTCFKTISNIKIERPSSIFGTG